MVSLIEKELVNSTASIVMAISGSPQVSPRPSQERNARLEKEKCSNDTAKLRSLSNSSCQRPASATLSALPQRPRQRRTSSSSDRSAHSALSGFTSYSTRPTPTFSAPQSLLSLLSLATQHQIGRSSRFSASPDGRPDFVLTSPLSLPAPHSARVVHLRPARHDDLEAIARLAQRSGEVTDSQRHVWPRVERYPGDFKRSMKWEYKNSFHSPSTVILVAEIANAVGKGAEKMRKEIVGVLCMDWSGKKRKVDADGRRYSGLNRVQLKPIFQHHLSDMMLSLALKVDRSLDKEHYKAIDSTTDSSTFLPASESDLDRAALFTDIAPKYKRVSSCKRPRPKSAICSTSHSPVSTTIARRPTTPANSRSSSITAVSRLSDNDCTSPSSVNPTDEDLTTRGSRGDFWFVCDVTVDPDHVGTGIGGRLLRLAAAAARARHEFVTTLAPLALEPFYEKQGFRRFGITRARDGREWIEMYCAPRKGKE